MKYLKIDINAYNPSFKLPPFLGSMLRGAFGASLKDVVCIFPSRNCENCFAKDNCIYFEFYEEKYRFLNYRFDFNLYPKELNFSLYLFNERVEKYPYILSTIHRMLTVKGLGKERVVFEIKSIDVNGKNIYDKEFKEIKTEPKSFECDRFCPKVKVKFVTPLRLKKEGRFLKPDSLDIKDVLISIYKKRIFFDQIDEKIESFPKILKKDLMMVDFTRYSNRQKKKLKIGGIVGEMIVDDLTPQTYKLLKYGEISGVGKLNTFGLGKIEVEDVK